MKKTIAIILCFIMMLSVVSAETVKISKITDIKATVNLGDKYAPPAKVKATMSDKSTRDVAITWDKKVDTAKAGIYVLKGTVKDYSAKVNLTVEVIKIASIADMKMSLNVEDKTALPKVVSATMSNKSKKEVAVTWDKKLDTSKDGTFTFLGTVNGYDKKVKLVVTIAKLPVTGASQADAGTVDSTSAECH